MALLYGGPLIQPISTNYKLYRIKLSEQSVIPAGIFIIIWRIFRRIRVIPLYYERKIIKVNDIYKIESAKFMHKYINKKLPDYFQNYFNKVSGNHDYSTRAATNDDLTIPFFRTNHCQKSFKYQGSKLWNSLPKIMTKLNYEKFI